MQHYINLGLGFSGSLLTPEQALVIWEQTLHLPDSKVIGLWLVPFTEDYEGGDWASIVVKKYGEISNAGKMDTIESLNFKSSKIILSKDEHNFIAEKFQELGISHLIPEIKPIIYSSNC